MDFAFSEEQEMLRQQAREFLTDKFPPERVAELADERSFDESTWKEMAGLGWIGLSVPEEKGGAGFGFLEEAVLFEELGRALYPGPYFATVAQSLPALQDSEEVVGRVVSGEARVALAAAESADMRAQDFDAVGTKAEQTNGAWSITGEKVLVVDAAAATDFCVGARTSDGTGIWLVPADQAEVQRFSTMDTTRPLGKVTFNSAQAQLLVEPGTAKDILTKIHLRSMAAAALEAVGVAQTVLDLSIEHTKERKQFDKPIGTYQAVSHQVANTYVDTELARSLAYWAAWSVAENDESAAMAVAAAKSHAAESAVLACERSIQVHGGIGFTWEHVLHRYYKRAQWIDSFGGFGSKQRQTVAAAVLDD
jgi:alkylation response protein AidB-like acyl-CoA dehydrogenase